MEARFTRIDVEGDTVTFAVEDIEARSFTFRFKGFEKFVHTAVALVQPTGAVTDTDQLLDLWFEFDMSDIP